MLSRVASNLYWLSRYVERAENTARVLDVAWRMSLLVKEPRLQDQEWFAPLNITGTLNVLGTAATTISTLGGVNTAGLGSYNLTGVLAGTGTLAKAGGGTLFLNPSDSSGFSGTVRTGGAGVGRICLAAGRNRAPDRRHRGGAEDRL